MTDIRFRKLVVFGVGLIGGSFAMALKKAAPVDHVVGVGRSRAESRARARAGRDRRDRATTRGRAAGADLVLVAVPVQQTARVFAAIAPHLEPDAVIDRRRQHEARRGRGGAQQSRSQAHAVRACPPGGGCRVVRRRSGHRRVVSGSHRGAHAAGRDRRRSPRSKSRRRGVHAARACVEMTAARHDEIFAAVSHLPHALAFTLVEMLAGRDRCGRAVCASPAPAFATSRASRAAHPRCGATSALRTATRCWRRSARFKSELATLAAAIESGDGARHRAELRARARPPAASWLRSRQ